jgi:hypothetical protein
VTIALGPFAIWYSDEARNYATMMFFVTVAIIALLEGVRGGGRRWWVLYAVTACAALWCHYTAGCVIAAAAVWALWTHRARSREVLLANGAVVLGYLPWLPGFLEQRQNEAGIDIIDRFAPVTFRTIFEVPTQVLVGHPFYDTGKLPGPLGWAFLAVLLVLGVAAVMGDRVKPPRIGRFLRSEHGLIAILAIATPVGLLLYAATGTSLYIPRNLSPSLPALAVAAALGIDALAVRAPRALAVTAVAGLIGLLAVGTIKSMGDEYRRPPFREAAHHIDDVAQPGDAVLHSTAATPGAERLPKETLSRYFERDHALYPITAGAAPLRVLEDGHSIFVVTLAFISPTRALLLDTRSVAAPPELIRRYRQLGGPNGRAVWRGEKELPGIFPVSVSRYQGLVEGRLERRGGNQVISWTLDHGVRVTPQAAQGRVESVAPPGDPLVITGWAIDAARRRPVDWILFFNRDRLLAVSPGGVPRPDIAKRFGPSAERSGFVRPVADAPARRSAIRVFAVTGDRASELELPGARQRSAGGR